MFFEIIFTILATYFLCGLIFAIVFIIKGITMIDENAQGSTIGFKIIIIPGVMVFWPLLFKKWLTANRKKLQ
jgi:hypothetical protein